jgi:hypothetical protein
VNNGIAQSDRGVEGFMIKTKRKAVRRPMPLHGGVAFERDVFDPEQAPLAPNTPEIVSTGASEPVVMLDEPAQRSETQSGRIAAAAPRSHDFQSALSQAC